MFPPNLQKNIRELDRQISLLETECETMESEKREVPLRGDPLPVYSKPLTRELPNKPFITGPSFSASFYSVKGSGRGPIAPKIYSASCAHIKTTSMKLFKGCEKPETVPPTEEPNKKRVSSLHKRRGKNSTSSETTPKENGARSNLTCEESERTPNKEELSSSSGEREEVPGAHTSIEKDAEMTCRGSINSIVEVSEVLRDTLKEKKSIKADEAGVSVNPRTKSQKENQRSKQNPGKISGGGMTKVLGKDEKKDLTEKWVNENKSSPPPPDRISSKRRSRSARTKKNSMEEVSMEVTMEKNLHEKEIQCMLWNEEREKAEFLVNLNDSIRTLHLSIAELKRNSSQEKRNDVVQDMQKTLMKISGIKSMNAINSPLAKFGSSNSLEGETNILDLRKALFGVKQFCQELSDEKSVLSEELATKNLIIADLKNKEKEYLSLISNLKFNLEKIRGDAEEGIRAKRDVRILKNKLHEEAKVIEALKKSHGKMQELIENYVLANDKLRTQVKLARLESHKYNVLLAGKEVEIGKYKEEIQSFQRIITEQLSILRSKASESEVEKAMVTLRNQRNILRTEVESCLSETTIENGEINKKPNLESRRNLNKNSFECSCAQPTPEERRTEPSTESRDIKSKEAERAVQPKSSLNHKQLKEAENKFKDYELTISKSNHSDPEERNQKCKLKYDLELPGIQKASKHLRNSIDEMLQEMSIDSSEKCWPSTPDSTNTSQCTIVSSAENTSELS